jgi:hypothetical protein
MKRLLAAAAIAVSLAVIPPASAAPPALLHRGSHGQAVADLQWLLGGHKPSAYHGIDATFTGKPNGLFGARTAAAVVAMKRRLGWPDRALTPVAGNDLRQILLGQKRRPLGWITRAASRLKVVSTVRTSCTSKIIQTASRELGAHEIPDGSNDGPRIRIYQAMTGAFRAPWCASFVQYVLATSGYGTIANRSAGVFYIRDWSYKRGWLHAIPKPGALVAFLNDLGHIGIIQQVTAHGFWSIEGNAGNAVRRIYRPLGSRPMAFVWLPSCS